MSARFRAPGLQFLGFLDSFFDAADHVERLFWQVVVVTVEDAFEASNGVFQGNVFTRSTGEDFSHEERLRQETLDLTSTVYQLLVGFRQLVHTQDRNDVLQFFVTLQHVLNAASGVVVLLADHVRVQLARSRVEWIDRWVDTQGSDVTGQNDGGVQVGEGGSWRRVGQVIRRYVYRLDRSDRTFLGRSDTFLQNAHLFSQGRLVTYCRRHTAQQCGYFSTGQGVTIDVVDEQQNVVTFVTELLGHGQAGQCYAQTVTRRLVHLTVNQCHFVQNVGILHLVVEVVTLTSTLTPTGEHGITAVLDGDVTDQFHHVYGLAYTGTTEQTDFTAFGERANQVDNLDAGFQQVVAACLLCERRCSAVDTPTLFFADRASFVNRVAQYVHDPAQGRFTDRYGDGCASVGNVQTTLQAFGRTHRNGTHYAVAQLLLNFQSSFRALYFQRVVDARYVFAWKFHVNNGADDLNNTSATHSWLL